LSVQESRPAERVLTATELYREAARRFEKSNAFIRSLRPHPTIVAHYGDVDYPMNEVARGTFEHFKKTAIDCAIPSVWAYSETKTRDQEDGLYGEVGFDLSPYPNSTTTLSIDFGDGVRHPLVYDVRTDDYRPVMHQVCLRFPREQAQADEARLDADRKFAEGRQWLGEFGEIREPRIGSTLRIKLPAQQWFGIDWARGSDLDDDRHPGPYDTIGVKPKPTAPRVWFEDRDGFIIPVNSDAVTVARAMRGSRQNLAMYERER
jgi:hypothetical protein